MPWKRGQRLHLVAPEGACPEVAEIYDQMKSALSVPFIDKLHQAFGVFPRFLDAHWERIKPIVESDSFFSCADRIGGDAYTRIHSYLKVPDIRSELKAANLSEGARQEIRNSVDLFHRASTYSLLLCAWQRRAFEGPVGRPPLLRGKPAAFQEEGLPIIMRDDAMPPATKKTLDELRKALGAPELDTFYFAMARWPDLLRDFWMRVRIEMQSPMYDHCKEAIREHAEQLCDELPGPLELTTVQLLEVMDETEIGSMVRITDAFEQSMSALVLNVAWTRIGLEGGNQSQKKKTESEPATPHEPTSPTAA